MSLLLDKLDALVQLPEYPCQWCLSVAGEWCHSDCSSPERRCSPEVVAKYAGEHAASDADEALIVAAVNALPKLTAALRAVLDLADGQDAELQARGVRFDRAIRPGDTIRRAIANALEATQ